MIIKVFLFVFLLLINNSNFVQPRCFDTNLSCFQVVYDMLKERQSSLPIRYIHFGVSLPHETPPLLAGWSVLSIS